MVVLIVLLLKEKDLTISSCESLTGGLFASRLVEISGASSVLVGSYVTYMDRCKEVLLNGKEVLNEVGAISKEMAYLMAKTVKEKLNSDISVSFTGNAGPSLSEGKEAGLVYSCIIILDKKYEYKDIYQGDRNSIRNQVVDNTIERILQNI